jgi:eukaryotic-like serine/threonine-protein kinase
VDDASLIGRKLDDRYRVLEAIGDGGMGRVFRAEQVSTGRTVALKVLHSELSSVEEIVRRFEREAEVTTRLSHPRIVKTVEFGNWHGRLYLAMEFLAGRSLAALLDADAGKTGGRLPVGRAIAIMRQVLDALEYAHGCGVVHRDLKPENIMVLLARGVFSRECVKLLDFGIARLGDDGDVPGRKLTQLGLVLGTPGYMSPEQAAGQTADVRSDLYACGVILYEMLAGRRPFEGDNLQVLAMHLNAVPKPLREVVGDASISPQVESVVMRALAKRPEERFQSARELRQALDRAVRIRSGDPGISGVEKTILAMPQSPSSGTGWMRGAVIAVASALLVGEHLEAVASRNNGAIASTRKQSEPGDAEGPPRKKESGLKRSRAASRRHPVRP